MNLQKQTLEIDGERIVCEYDLRNTNAVILHGAGQSNRTRSYGLANALLEKGVGVVLFDFSGHGESSGQLSELSLERRATQAQSVIDALVPADSPLYLIGFSMGGQTLSDILPLYLKRVRGVLLCCPAMYSEQAWQLPFGDPKFTHILRSPESWKESMGPKHLAAFKGKVIIAIGSEDKVIPSGVVQRWREAALQSVFVQFNGVDHKLSRWFGAHPNDAAVIVDKLIN